MSRVHRRTRTHLIGIICAALVGVGLAALTTIATAPAASAHGNVNDPLARGYRCLKLYGDIWYANAFKDSDPMCSNAFQTSPNAMWNWNGMLIDGLAGNYASVTDLCSANNATYGVLSIPGDWKTTDKPAKFNINLVDGAAHGADWIRTYISKDGFDPTTKKLTWSDLVQVGEIGKIYNPGNGTIDPKVGGSAYSAPVDATGYTGRRVLFTHWKASHADQTYYLCSDVNITSGGGGVTTTTTRPVTTTTTTTTRPVTTTTTTGPVITTTTTTTTRPATTTSSPGTTGGCSASYATTGTWTGGFQGAVTVKAGSGAISKWKLTFTLPSGVSITSSWSAVLTTSGSTVTASNMPYNGSLAAGASTVFGFLGSGSASGWTPSVTCSTA
jgi:predicted carbohydrate-binding protein with CBM5 and CBM33 domain